MLKFWLDGVIKTLIGSTGFFINCLGIWILFSKPKMRTLYHYIFACLLISNNLYLFCSTLTTLFYEFECKSVLWTIPHFAIPFEDISLTANLLTTICLSYERFVICADPTKYRRQKSLTTRSWHHKIVKYMCLIVLFSITYNLPRFFTYKMPEPNQKQKPQKTSLRNDSDFKLYYKGVRWIIFTTISLSTLLYLNWEIFQRITKILISPTPNVNKKVIDVSNIEKTKPFGMKVQLMKLIRKRERLIFALFLLVIVSLICSSLKLAEETIQAMGIGKKTDGIRELKMFARVMLVVNSSVNVWIYCLSDKRFCNYFFSYFMLMIYFVSCKYVCKPSSAMQNGIKNRRYELSSVTDSSIRSRRSSKRHSAKRTSKKYALRL